MGTKLLYFILHLIAVALAIPAALAYAQTYDANSKYGNGVVNSAGQWADQVGTVGAQANRNTADQLFKQALQHEAQGIATLNVGLLSQALTESQQGIKADDQARHLAQTSLQALKSGNTAGNVDLSGKYGTSEDAMRAIANSTSSYYPQVQSKLSGYGIKIDHDASVIKTPFGTFPINASPEDMAKAMAKVAGALGYSGDVGAGVKAGLANANGIAKKAAADAQLSASKGSLAVASDTATSGDGGASANSDESKGPDSGKTAAQAAPKEVKLDPSKAATSLTAEQDMQARLTTINKQRAEMLAGMDGVKDLFGDRGMDLFKIVHDRYQEMRHQGSFNEYGGPERMAASVPR